MLRYLPCLAWLHGMSIAQTDQINPLVELRYTYLKTGHSYMQTGHHDLARGEYWNAIMGGLVEEGFHGYELAWAADGAQYMAHVDMARAFHLRALHEVEQQDRDWADGDIAEAERHLVAATTLNPAASELDILQNLLDSAKAGNKLVTPAIALSDSFGTVRSFDLWGDGGIGAGSGPGSAPNATQLVSNLLVHIVLKHGISSMLDAACGGMAWMPSVLRSIDRLRLVKGLGNDISNAPFQYTCVDVVPDLINSLQRKYSTQPNWSFLSADLSVSENVVVSHDLIFARDFLFHLSTPRVLSILDAFIKSGSRLLIATHNPYSDANVERAIWHAGAPVQHGSKPLPMEFTGGLDQGGYRPVNLHLPPYNLPAPMWEVIDEPTELSLEASSSDSQWHAMSRVLAMWNISELKKSSETSMRSG